MPRNTPETQARRGKFQLPRNRGWRKTVAVETCAKSPGVGRLAIHTVGPRGQSLGLPANGR
jgi:hypothetical protein